MDKTMGSIEQSEINITPTAPEAAAPKVPSLGQRALRRVINNIPALGGLGAFLLFPAAGRAKTQFTSNTPNEPEISAQTPPAEAVAGAVDMVEPIIEPAPALESPAASPEAVNTLHIESPNKALILDNQEGWSTKLEIDKDGIIEYENELLANKAKVQFVPDETITSEMVKSGISPDSAIAVNSCLEITPFDPRYEELKCYDRDKDWIYFKPVLVAPGIIEVRYRVLDPSMKPSAETFKLVQANINESYIPTYIGFSYNQEKNSLYSLELRTKMLGKNAVVVSNTTTVLGATDSQG